MLRVAFAGGATRSTCLCVLEAVLAAIVFVYTALYFVYSMRGSVKLSIEQDHRGFVHEALLFVLFTALLLTDGVFGIVLFVTGCAVRTGVAHSVGRLNPSGGASPGDADRLERDRLAESLELDGVNLFDFHEVVTTSVSILSGFLAWLLFQLVSLAFSLPFAFLLVMSSIGASENLPVWLVFTALQLVASVRLFYALSVGDKFRKLEQSCRTQPSCKLVRAVLVLSSIAYAVVVCVSPAPPVWQWSLIVTHAARALKLLVSLRDQSEGVGAAAAHVPRDTL